MRILVRGTTTEHPIGPFVTINSSPEEDLVFQLGETRVEGQEDNIDTVMHGQQVVDLKALFKPKTFYNIFEISGVTFEGKATVYFSEPIDSKSRERSLAEDVFHKDVLAVMGRNPLIGIYFHETADDVTIMVNKNIAVDYSNVDYEQAPSGKALLEIVLEEKTELENYRNICLARQKMLRASDPNTSLAYIEAQLDILTKLVLLIIERNPALKQDITEGFPELESFSDIVNRTSLLKVKDVERCLVEINETKAKIRQLQIEYFSVKEANR